MKKRIKKKRSIKELDILCNRIIEILAENGLWSYAHSVYERNDGVIKVMLAIYPKKLLEEKGMIKRFEKK